MGRPIRVLFAVLVPLVAAVGAAVWLAFGETGDVDVASGSATSPPVAQTSTGPSTAAGKRTEAPATVSGEVRRGSDGVPVAGVLVCLEGVRPRALETSTDERGAFQIASVPHGGPYCVVVTAPECAE